MPIDYTEYPPDWKEIRARILLRADNACEGSPNHPDCRAKNGSKRDNGTTIVLTIAHLDHDKENFHVKDERLRAWCQRCHLMYDLPRHIENRKYGRNFRKDQTKLF